MRNPLLCPFLVLLTFVFFPTFHHAQAFRLHLFHRNAHSDLTGLQRIKHLLRHDVARYDIISRRRVMGRRRLKQDDAAVQIPLVSGRDYGTGQYFTQLRVGTPPQKFRLVVDTGSELTWVRCKYRCGDKCGKRGVLNRGRVFDADRSVSFRTVPCFSQTCKVDLMNLFSLTRCPSRHTPCAYDYRYLDGSSALGIFAKEKITVGRTNEKRTSLHGVLIGCSQSFQGQSFRRADGVLGLAHSPFSFTTKATDAYGGKFSYCLADHLSHKNVSNYLFFGDREEESQTPCVLASKRHTKLELDLIPPFYALNVVGISIADKMLKIPPEVWDANRGGGTMLDTGTTLTILAEPAYGAVISALLPYVSKYKKVRVDEAPLKHCFNGRGFDENMVPQMTFHFADGARLEPHRKSYVIDVSEGVKCLGLLSAGSPGTNVIGNIMQQNYLWEFDLVRGELSFAPSTCT